VTKHVLAEKNDTSVSSQTTITNNRSHAVKLNCMITTATTLHPLNGLFSRTTWISQHQKGKSFWILLEQEMIGWRWHQLDHMQIICTLLQTDNHASTSSLSFLQAGCPSCHPTNSIKALKALNCMLIVEQFCDFAILCK